MADRVKIVYREFYDVPRMLIVSRRGLKLLLDSPFDDSPWTSTRPRTGCMSFPMRLTSIPLSLGRRSLKWRRNLLGRFL